MWLHGGADAVKGRLAPRPATGTFQRRDPRQCSSRFGDAPNAGHCAPRCFTTHFPQPGPVNLAASSPLRHHEARAMAEDNMTATATRRFTGQALRGPKPSGDPLAPRLADRPQRQENQIHFAQPDAEAAPNSPREPMQNHRAERGGGNEFRHHS